MKTQTAVITGINGFIGSALAKKLTDLQWNVSPCLQPHADYVFLFGSPSSDHWFHHAMGYSFMETIGNFITVAEYCRSHGIKLVYPSSGTVYAGKTPYSKCKKILDLIAESYGRMLGVRIFAGYGPGEGHKGDYASIVYKFCKSMKNGESPVIWGDGKQTRDFIYIDDIVDEIIWNRDRFGFMDLGTGIATSLTDVVALINKELHTSIVPVFEKQPETYITETVSRVKRKCRFTLADGIREILKTL